MATLQPTMAPDRATETASPRRPPGSYGPPFIGSLLGTAEFFLLGWERYFTRRRDRHGSTVFRVNIFRPTIAVLDRTGIAPLFSEDDLIQDYGFSWAKPARELVGHVVPSVFETGPAHDGPKAFFLELVAERGRALPGVFDAVADEFFRRWMQTRSFIWADELEDFAVCLVFEWILGARPNVAAVRDIYNNIFVHFLPWLERLFPRSNYSRSIRAYAELIAFIRQTPRFGELAAMASRHGVDEAALPHRLAFLLGMNGFLGTQSLLKSVVGELSQQEAVRAALQAELAGLDATQALTRPSVDRFLWEVMRLHPPVFFVFGRATQARTLATASGAFAIAQGELVMGVIPFAQQDAALFPEPGRFRPERYGAAAGTQRDLIWARGPQDAAVQPNDRICPGKDPAMLFGKLFCTRLAGGFRWRLDTPPTWSKQHFGLNVAAPVGNLSVRDFEVAT